MRRAGLAALWAILLCSGIAQADPIRIGAILPLTGPAATIGLQQMRGIRLALDEANAKGGLHGNKVEVAFADSQAKPDLAILCFNRLTDQEHLQVIFTAYSSPTLAMAPLATRKQVLLVNAGAQADRLAVASPYLFNTLPPISAEIAVLSRFLASQGIRRAAILFENDPAGISGRDDFVDAFPRVGGTIVAQQSTYFGQTDFRHALLQLAEAKPEMMLVAVTSGLDAMAKQYREAGLNFAVAGTTFLHDLDLLQGSAAEGFVHTQIRVEPSLEAAAAFEQKFGVAMEFPARQYYNAARIVLTALDRLLADGQPITGAAMRKIILKVRNLPVQFDTNTAAVPIDIDRIHAGKDRRITD
jgi:branched-chain amino acid transport system substrate-binding protein